MAEPAALASQPGKTDAVRAEREILFHRKLQQALEACTGQNTMLLTDDDACAIRRVLEEWDTKKSSEWKLLYGTRPWSWRKKYRILNMAGQALFAHAVKGIPDETAGILDK
eukprot:6205243-Pleurochrysis_carterae.AAC.1